MFSYDIPVRYSECDVQGVLFNAHYLAYCDHTMDEYLRSALGDDGEFELMVKSAQVTWFAPLRYRETAVLGCEVTRWGTTSMAVHFLGVVAGDVKFEATLTYVCVAGAGDTAMPSPIPTSVRNAFETLT